MIEYFKNSGIAGLPEKIAKNKLSGNINIVSNFRISKFPSIQRDITFIVSQNILAEQLLNIAHKSIPKNLFESIRIIDFFQSQEMKLALEKSLSIRIVLCSLNKTLENNEIDNIIQMIIKNASNKLGAKLRI